MLCLYDSIRHNDPAVQRLLSAVDDAHALSAFILAAWQVAPLDEALGVQPHQRTSGELQALSCALAFFVPFATAARLLSWYIGGTVSPQAVWEWVQAAGQQVRETLQRITLPGVE